MKVSYKKLWVLCAEKEMSKAELRKRAGISSATFTKLRKNQEVTLSVILKIAEVLDCNAGDMMDFIKDDEYAELEDVGVEEVLRTDMAARLARIVSPGPALQSMFSARSWMSFMQVTQKI